MKRLIAVVVSLSLAFWVIWPAYSGYQIHSALQAQDTAALDRKIDFPSVRVSMREPVVAHVHKRMADVMESYGPLASLIGSKVPKKRISGLVDGALVEVVNAKSLGRIYAAGGDIGSEIQRAVLAQIEKTGGILSLFGGSRKGKKKGAGGTDTGNADNGGDGGGFDLSGGLGALVGGGAAGGLVDDVLGDVAGKIGNIDPEKLAKKLFPKLAKSKRRSGKGGSDGSSFGLGNVKSFGFSGGPLGLHLGVAKESSATEPDVTAHISFQDFDWKVTKLVPNL